MRANFSHESVRDPIILRNCHDLLAWQERGRFPTARYLSVLDLFRDLVGDPAASDGALDKRLTIARHIDPAEAAGSSMGLALLRVVAQHQDPSERAALFATGRRRAQRKLQGDPGPITFAEFERISQDVRAQQAGPERLATLQRQLRVDPSECVLVPPPPDAAEPPRPTPPSATPATPPGATRPSGSGSATPSSTPAARPSPPSKADPQEPWSSPEGSPHNFAVSA